MARSLNKQKTASADQRLYIITESKCTIDGKEYSVSYVQMSICINQIPTITLGLGVPTKENPYVTQLSLEGLSSALSTLTKAARDKSKASVKIALSCSEGGSDQSLHVENWVVIGAGLSDVSTTAPFSLECTIAHPAYALTTTQAFTKFSSEDPLASLKPEELNDIHDLVAAGKKALALFAAAEKDAVLPSLGSHSVALPTEIKEEREVQDILKAGLSPAISALDKYLEWDYSLKLPGGSLATSNPGDGIKYAMLNAWLQEAGNGSIWSTLMNTICPKFLCEVIPVWGQDKLQLCPVVARDDGEYEDKKISTEDIALIDFPAYDPNPVYGVIMQFSQSYTAEGALTFSYAAGENVAVKNDTLAFIPAGVDTSTGVLLSQEDPDWIGFAGVMAQGYTVPPEENKDGAEGTYSGSDNQKSPPSGDDSPLDVWNDIRLKYLADVFQIEYKKSVAAMLQMPLNLIPGDRINPGDFLTVQDQGKELFHGKVYSVLHSIDCARSTASTIIDLQYCGYDAQDDKIVGSDHRPALYT